MIKSGSIRWECHEGHIREKRNAFEFLVRKPEGKKLLGLLMHGRKILQEVLERTNGLLPFDTTWTAQKTTPPAILRCRWNVFTEQLPSSDTRGYTYRWEGFMIWVSEMDSGFMKIGSGIQKLIGGGGYSQTHRQPGDRISLL
jgi:hypothetical protein